MTVWAKIHQIYRAMFGVANTDEKGMVGDIQDIKNMLKSILKGKVKE